MPTILENTEPLEQTITNTNLIARGDLEQAEQPIAGRLQLHYTTLGETLKHKYLHTALGS